MTAGAMPLAFLAGLLTVLSPCVLPLLPIVFGTAASEHRLGPAALAAGLALSFTLVGLFVATIGFAIGLDADLFRLGSAVLLIGIGIVLVSPRVQERVAAAAGPFSNWLDRRFGGGVGHGLAGQFGLGGLLGAVWSPCVGPTLGAASVLAAQGKDLPQVALTMLAFGIGAGLPLLFLGSLSRPLMLRLRGLLGSTGGGLKAVLGLVLLLVGGLILSGQDKVLEALLVEASPDWLNRLTTRF